MNEPFKKPVDLRDRLLAQRSLATVLKCMRCGKERHVTTHASAVLKIHCGFCKERTHHGFVHKQIQRHD